MQHSQNLETQRKEGPIGRTSCARLEATKADIRRYTLIAQGFENMITSLRQSSAQDEHDPTFVEMVKQRTIYEDLLEKRTQMKTLDDIYPDLRSTLTGEYIKLYTDTDEQRRELHHIS
ncbi:hypothetical protein TNIN_138171 [Trichonephila inaurata madagascariensis]|uniref:Uncharacterized protein n=1 Tax=Trichonephila inaurata madagascariensis TaxID=2747483 RepID=A0A8X6XI33_9ARAC|nr:hypothetical protein TNIN_429881 [Trichonephila inaurata madagascariensis]GFY69325.1 hypothetical protein TNIN_138171 [Trichonephila inaurata madagascariensis]